MTFRLHIGHSALSFVLLEIGVPSNPLFSLLHQKIDFFLKNFFLGGHRRFQMSKIDFNSIWNRRFQIIWNKRQKFQKQKKIIVKNTYNEFWATLLELIWNLLKSNWNLLKSIWNLMKYFANPGNGIQFASHVQKWWLVVGFWWRVTMTTRLFVM